MGFAGDYSHEYDFKISGRNLTEIEERAMEEASRYYGERDFIVVRIDGAPHTYHYEEGAKMTPLVIEATVFTVALRSLDGRTHRSNSRRRSRTSAGGGRAEH